MAERVRWVCSSCRTSVEAWSDGNPYVVEDGRKRYVYHPNHEALARAVGNDVPVLCLACGAESVRDSQAPEAGCPACGSSHLQDAFDLRRAPLPRVRVRHVRAGPRWPGDLVAAPL